MMIWLLVQWGIWKGSKTLLLPFPYLFYYLYLLISLNLSIDNLLLCIASDNCSLLQPPRIPPAPIKSFPSVPWTRFVLLGIFKAQYQMWEHSFYDRIYFKKLILKFSKYEVYIFYKNQFDALFQIEEISYTFWITSSIYKHWWAHRLNPYQIISEKNGTRAMISIREPNNNYIVTKY